MATATMQVKRTVVLTLTQEEADALRWHLDTCSESPELVHDITNVHAALHKLWIESEAA